MGGCARWAVCLLLFIPGAAIVLALDGSDVRAAAPVPERLPFPAEWPDAPVVMLADGGDSLGAAPQLAPLTYPPWFIAAIDRAGDRDWYAIGSPDSAPDDFYVRVQTAGSCNAVRPLLLKLYNPEGKWIRTVAFSTTFDPNDSRFRTPSLEGRYYIDILAVDFGCSGLQYSFLPRPGSAGAGASIANASVLCRIAHNDRVLAAGKVRLFERRRRGLKNPASRRRYTGYLKSLRRSLRDAQTAEHQRCS
jgi:hypothetical protein